MSTEITRKSIVELLGPPADISSIKDDSESSFSQVAFELYKETSIVAVIASNLSYSSDSEKGALPLYQAVEAALIVRISKFMASVLALLCDKNREHGEVIMALNRCISESAIKLRFFCERADDEDFDNFIKSSLKPEKDLFDTVQKNIAKRGKALAIETRIINSVSRVFRSSGITKIDELERIPKRKNYIEFLRALGMEENYPMLQGVPSHSIHGNWVDLLLHHLEERDGAFLPKPDSVVPDTRLLCPINMLILTAVRSYIVKHFLNNHDEINILLNRIDNLIERNMEVEALHEKYLSLGAVGAK